MNTDTIKKFIQFFWWLVGFFVLSLILENAFISNMYKPMGGLSDSSIVVQNDADSNLDLEVTVSDAKSTKTNGYVVVNMKNTTGSYIDGCSAKIDLYTSNNVLAGTKYIDIEDFDINESRQYKVYFNGEDISRYSVSLLEESPDRSNIIEVFGHDIDTTDFFGVDLSDLAKKFDIDFIDINNEAVENAKSKVNSGWNWGLTFARSVPTWAYVAAFGIIIWSLPSGYLFGIF